MPDKNPIPVETLRQLLRYEPEKGKLFWRSGVKLGMEAGYLNKILGYRYVQILGRNVPAHRIIMAIYNGEWPDGQVDHINHIRDDNRILNLRIVSLQENRKNQAKRKSNKSGATGVFWYKQRNKWLAYIRSNNKRIFLGYHDNFDDAVAARLNAERQYGFHPNHGT